MSYYPVFLDLRGRRCVVLGDNAVAREKVAVLVASGAAVDHHPRSHRDGDLHDAYLAIDASGDPDSNRAARAEAERHHVLLNVADVTDLCDWIAPAVVRRGPLQIAISTAGESPFVASTIRQQLERLFGEEWEPFTQVVGTVRRRLRRRGVGADQQRRAYKRLLQSPLRRLLREGRYTEAADVSAAIERAAGASRGTPPGQVVLVGAGPGDPDLITVAGREALQCADVVFHDALVGQRMLELASSDARLVNVGKRAGRPSMPQDEINALLIAAARDGQFVVRLKGGDPLLFARGGEEIGALLAEGIAVRVIPGVSSALASPGAAGFPVTHRGVAASVAITTGQQAAAGPDRLADLAAAADTLIVLMPSRLDDIAARIAAVVGADRPAALVSAATLPGQRVIVAPVGEIAALAQSAERGDSSPRTLVVGDVVQLALDAATEPSAKLYSSESVQP